jgi:hypothetical protein
VLWAAFSFSMENFQPTFPATLQPAVFPPFPPITVSAHLPPIRSAITSKRAQGMVIKFAIPESEVTKAFRLQLIGEDDLLGVVVERESAKRQKENADFAHHDAESLPTSEGLSPRLEFRARLAPRDACLMRAGNGDGMQLHLLVPPLEVPAAFEIQLWTNINFILTLRVTDEKERNEFLIQEREHRPAQKALSQKTARSKISSKGASKVIRTRELVIWH